MRWEREVKGGNKRIDLYLSKGGLHLSRNRVKRLIKEGKVLVNGHPVKPNYVVKDGDEIVVEYEPFIPADVEPENIPLDIVYEDRYLVVVNKPMGMVVHPAKGHLSGTLVNALLYHTGKKLAPGTEPTRPGVVHRLDKDTTGLILFAKEPSAHTYLSGEIYHRRVKRVYLAIVWGRPPLDEGTVNAPIGRHLIFREKMAVTPFGSRNAVTHFKVLYSTKLASILKVTLETGRTHQIRVHLSHIGYPIVGDPDYGGRDGSILQKIGVEYREKFYNILHMIERQALHAMMLGFRHPVTGEWMNFYAPIPDDMRKVIREIIR